jgi:hypothetical protein
VSSTFAAVVAKRDKGTNMNVRPSITSKEAEELSKLREKFIEVTVHAGGVHADGGRDF